MSSDWSVWKHANAQRKMKFAVYFVYCDCMYYLVGNLHGSDKIYAGCFVHELMSARGCMEEGGIFVHE